MKFDLQDALLIIGVGSLVGGVGAWSYPAAFILFGVICLGFAYLSGKAEGIKNGSAGK